MGATAQRRNREGDPVSRPAPPSRDLTRWEHEQAVTELTRSYELKLLKIQNALGVSHADIQKILSDDDAKPKSPAASDKPGSDGSKVSAPSDDDDAKPKGKRSK